jgi:CheY-like chemotaxis protein
VPYNLLLADDSVTIQRVIELTFADEDVTVVAVSDGDQAIERLEAAPPDIVLADIGMPGKNGYEVAMYMRRSPKLAHIPVVLLTGAFEPVDQARATDAGCDGVLAKPFEPQLVIGRVKELLAKARRAPNAPVAVGHEKGEAGAVANQRPAAPFVNPPAAHAPAGPPANAELNDYFDRLDAAFSTAPSATAPSPAPAQPAADPPGTIGKIIDWFTATAPAAAAPAPRNAPGGDASVDVPLSNAEPRFAVLDEGMREAPAEMPDERLSAIEESVPVESPAAAEPVAAAAAPVYEGLSLAPSSPHAALPAAAPALPSLPDAFAALLAAEQGDTAAAASALWPVDTTPAPAPAVTDEMIEDIVRRVLERLSDTVVREAISDVASTVAERLVLEEIARIRAAIK